MKIFHGVAPPYPRRGAVASTIGFRQPFSTRQKIISVGRAFMPDMRNHGTLSGMNARPTKCRVLKG
ncbi:hypothetical protein [Alysiella filiformis]|uniref:hypothetical protein n=1 Tax=Alysiella filiformis TaxID=194196 RepID=UPI0011782E1D|nr:hypothetical protein [Alysiella filiformis]QMT32163.1 hypothetical protein H3L97_04805 [Alysiella filiformis]UBQ56917.1 hypothetical protein JF568_03870 [Alysiella filiformis DSM 16848]